MPPSKRRVASKDNGTKPAHVKVARARGAAAEQHAGGGAPDDLMPDAAGARAAAAAPHAPLAHALSVPVPCRLR